MQDLELDCNKVVGGFCLIDSLEGSTSHWNIGISYFSRLLQSHSCQYTAIQRLVPLTQSRALMVRIDQSTMELAAASQRIWSAIEPPPSAMPCAESFCVSPNVSIVAQAKVSTIRSAYDDSVNMVELAQNARRSKQYAALVEPIAIKAKHIAWFKAASLKVGSGPVIGRQCTSKGREKYTTISGGYGINLSFHVPLWTSRRFFFSSFWLFPMPPNPGLDIRFKLKIPRLFSQKSAWHRAAQMGHMSSLRQWLISGDVGISDVTPQGDTLLHVSMKAYVGQLLKL
jgi:hypothetical protein